MFVILVPPLTAYVFATSNWPFGDFACRLMHYVVNVISSALPRTPLPWTPLPRTPASDIRVNCVIAQHHNVISYVTVYTLVLVAALRYMTIVRDNETAR